MPRNPTTKSGVIQDPEASSNVQEVDDSPSNQHSDPAVSQPNPCHGAGSSAWPDLPACCTGGITTGGFDGVPQGWRSGCSRGQSNGRPASTRGKVRPWSLQGVEQQIGRAHV